MSSLSYRKEKVLFDAFPKQQLFFKEVASRKYDFLLFGGSIRGGKTFAVLGLFIALCAKYPGSKYLVVRRSLQSIRDTVLPTFYSIRPEASTMQDPSQGNNWEWKYKNGSTIKFYAENIEKDPDLKRFRGLEYDSICFEEMDIQEKTFFVGFERCGTWRMEERDTARKRGERTPPTMVIGTSNPQGGWVKSLIYDKWVKGTLRANWMYIPSKVYDNPYVPQEWIDRQRANLTPVRFKMMVEGDWSINMNDRPFFDYFDEEKHVADGLEIDYNQILYLSFDFNWNPCSVVLGQIIEGEGLRYLKSYQSNGGTERLLHEHLSGIREEVFSEKLQIICTGDNNGHRMESSSGGFSDYDHIEAWFGQTVSDVTYNANSLHSHSRKICNHTLLKCNPLFDRIGCAGLIAEMKDAKTTDRGGLSKKPDLHIVDGYRYLNNLWFESIDFVNTFRDNIDNIIIAKAELKESQEKAKDNKFKNSKFKPL